ncbi:SDR family NAD(P)-dependent oxidoreductase [Nibricoccus sp. IMCC34717]|uniref:SDR family NAD(P)-dependent oxidoreductase n=1 Tax=Nibricoccus sp. IMCC34717 TaxID=3034021 RepID=UPI00384B9082
MRIIVSGTSTGIGQALAAHLLAKGHWVWGVARSAQSVPPGSPVEHFRSSRADVSDWPAMERLATEIAGAWGSVDAIVACAGVQGEVGPAMECDPVRWSATVRANLDGTYYFVRALFPLLKPTAARGKVVCFSGGGATKTRVNFSAYGVAKTGVVRLVETLAEEWRNLPVDINAVAPGAINTRLTDEVLALGPAKAGQAEYDAALKQKQKGGASLEKALGLVEYLLSAESDGISGRLLAAPWDPWRTLHTRREALSGSDIYTLRRIVPEERSQSWTE